MKTGKENTPLNLQPPHLTAIKHVPRYLAMLPVRSYWVGVCKVSTFPGNFVPSCRPYFRLNASFEVNVCRSAPSLPVLHQLLLHLTD